MVFQSKDICWDRNTGDTYLHLILGIFKLPLSIMVKNSFVILVFRVKLVLEEKIDYLNKTSKTPCSDSRSLTVT